MAGLIRRGLTREGMAVDVVGDGRGRAVAGRGDRLRRDRARRDAARDRRLRGLSAPARRRRLVADPDADGARRGCGPRRRARPRRRRLPDQALLLRGAAGPAAGAGAPRARSSARPSSRSATCDSIPRPGARGAATPRSSSRRRSSPCSRRSCAGRAQVLSRFQLLEHAWDYEYENRSNVVDSYIRFLRQKIDRPFGVDSIETVRGSRLPAARGRWGREPDADPAPRDRWRSRPRWRSSSRRSGSFVYLAPRSRSSTSRSTTGCARGRARSRLWHARPTAGAPRRAATAR